MARNAQQFADRLLAALPGRRRPDRTPVTTDPVTTSPDASASAGPEATVVPMQRPGESFAARLRKAAGA